MPQPSWRRSVVRSIARLFGVRDYDGAKNGGQTWGGQRVHASGSVDSDLSTARSKLRERSRHAYQNNASARAIVESLVGLVASTGIDVEPDTGNVQVDEQLRAAWNDWIPYADASGRVDFFELQRQAFRSTVSAGEFLWHLVDVDDPARPIPFAILALEPDQLSCTPVGPVAPGNTFNDGVECDRYGKPVAYHILDQVPDDFTAPYGGTLKPNSGGVQVAGFKQAGKRSGMRIPAEKIIHGYEVQRPGQTRGEPWLAPVLTTLYQERQLVDCELTAAKVGAAHALAITTEGGGWPGADDRQDSSNDGSAPTYDFSPGSVARLAAGEKIEVLANPRPSQQIKPFREMLRGDLAGAMRIPQRLIDRDVSRANYSSMRADMLDTRRQLDPVQQWFGRLAAVEVFRRALPQLALYAGVMLPAAGSPERMRMERAKAMPDGWQYVDPQKDIAASIEAIRAGLSTWQDEISAKGKDPRQVFSQLEKELQNPMLAEIFSEGAKKEPAEVEEQPQAAQTQTEDVA